MIPFCIDDLEERYIRMPDDQKALAEAAALTLLSIGDYSFRSVCSVLTDEDRDKLRIKLDKILTE
mgnify:CR=1 FL=1